MNSKSSIFLVVLVCLNIINIINGQLTEKISHTFTPSDLSTSFGSSQLLRGSKDSDKKGNEWWVMPAPKNNDQLSMSLKTTIFAGTDCNINNFEATYNIKKTGAQADAAIVISAGSEYISMTFDADGGITLSSKPSKTGGFGIYPQCNSQTLPIIKDNNIDFNYQLTSFDQTSTKQVSVWDFRDQLAGGDSNNWNVLQKKGLGKRSQYIIQYANDDVNNKLHVKFTAKHAKKKADVVLNCDFDTTFSFNDGKDVNIYFSTDFNDNEWQIWSVDVSTDCSASVPTPTQEPNECNECTDGIKSCDNEGGIGCNSHHSEYCEDHNEDTGNCNKCINGYFMKNMNYPCISCDNIDGCLECSDFLGCIKCDECNDFKHYFDKQCGIGRCMKQDAYNALWFPW